MLDTQNQLAFSQFWSAFCDEAYLNPAEERWDTYFNQRHPELTTSCVYPWRDCIFGMMEQLILVMLI